MEAVEEKEITELILVVKKMDRTGLTILKSQADALARYEELKRQEKSRAAG